eukprot:3616235-Rhodomonas_salina.1
MPTADTAGWQAPTFSSWEAQTYIPPIKKSWEQILMTVSIEQVGVVFYDKLFQASQVNVCLLRYRSARTDVGVCADV